MLALDPILDAPFTVGPLHERVLIDVLDRILGEPSQVCWWEPLGTLTDFDVPRRLPVIVPERYLTELSNASDA